MSNQSRMPDGSVLGDSWIMASTASIKDKVQNQSTSPREKGSYSPEEPASPSPQPRSSRKKNSAETTDSISSLTSSSSSWTTLGPELVMPSIYEVPISEASWVAPGVLSKDQSTMKKRRKISQTHDKHQVTTVPRSQDAGSSIPTPQPHTPSLIARLFIRYRDQVALRSIINALLIALILHLLVLPEAVYQLQDLCHLPPVKSIYPDSCIQLKPQLRPFLPLSNPIISPEQTISTAQKELESIFDITLQTLTPLAHILKGSETMLSDLQAKLQVTFPDAHNALDLEFQGSDQALRAAAWEFDSLRADLRSAIESLLSSPPTPESTGSMSIARDTRLAAQLRRRAEYLDRLRAQIRSKADSLTARFSTLDDHLEAVDGIVTREERRGSLFASDSRLDGVGTTGASLHAMLHSLSSYASFGSRWSRSTGDPSSVGSDAHAHAHAHGDEQSNENGRDRPLTTLALLRLAATHHRPVADSVSRLSRQLQGLQRGPLGPTW
ncbi:hypothetical protein N7478_012254 [Penicillium angulare]|uniref:uncharacterized protein n=1 Tax=Penicillium angulare TaxID=116970 RepID=UPI002541BF5D|nr:uncharacterized protein N7478_012254 [Penicillium angulare]KAJ5259273.1 hypothetical protein N7478_012254 [Penicillium angulare]